MEIQNKINWLMNLRFDGMPKNLLNSYYKLFNINKRLLQILDIKDYSLFPITFSILHREILGLMCRISRIVRFEEVYYYNILSESPELDLNNFDISLNIKFDEGCNIDTESYENIFKTETEEPLFYPYDKVLIPNLADLDFFIVDIEEISLSFLLVKKGIKSFKEIQKEVLAIVNKDEILKYINGLSCGNDLKHKLEIKCNYEWRDS